jgi:hypothetical protein
MAPARGVAAADMPAAAAALDAAAARGRAVAALARFVLAARGAAAFEAAAAARAGAFVVPAADAGKARPVSTFFTGLPLESIAWWRLQSERDGAAISEAH